MRCLVVAFTFAVVSNPSFVQRGGGSVPAIGTPLPDVTVFDEQGEEFSFRQLRGEYSVVVFGCLT